MTTEVPQLRDGVEQVTGMEGITMLYDSDSGTYHRIGSFAASVISTFDGVKNLEEIAETMNASPATTVHIKPEHVTVLVQKLEDKQLLVGGTPEKPRRRGLDKLLPRYTIAPNYSKVLAPIVEHVELLRPPIFSIIAVTVAIAGYILGIYALITGGSPQLTSIDPGQLILTWLIATLIQLFTILLHESWHGIVCGVCGQPIRGLGVALMFWVIPVAYVDRTDAYRLKSRTQRVAIAVAGMVSDGWVMGYTALIVLNSVGFTHQVATTLLLYQLFLLLANLNPFSPSDTVSAIEAATGAIDIRGRAHMVLASVLFRKSLPPYLRNITVRARILYFSYAAFSYLFAIWVMLSFAYSIWASYIKS